jgi:hypothetical protein
MSDLTLRNVKGTPLTNQEVDDNFSNLNADKYQAGDSPTFGDITADSVNITGGTGTQGTLSWNSVDGTLDLDLGTATLQVGQEEHFYAKATEAIANGDVVMFAGAQGNHVLIAKANHSAVGFKPEYIMGVATQAFANNAYGYVTTFGRVRDLNTSALDEGDILYSDPSNPGALTTTRPSPPDHVIQVAAVLRSNPAQGVILVRLTHFLDTDEVEEGSTNLYFTDARAVSAIQADASWNASDWDTAYGWGDHSTQGYAATTYVDTSVANLVDSAPATLDTLNELAAALGDDPNFATTVTNSIATKLPLSGGTLTGNLGLGDNVRATFGDSNDLQIWHDGSNSYVKDSGTGDLKLQGNNFTIGNTADVKYFTATNGGAVELYHQGNQKLQTTTTGIDVTGNVALADNGKAIFGASDDLQIYHDGSNSVIKDGGTGNLNILAGQLRIKNPTDAESLIEADVNGEVRLYHDNAEKLTTTSTGIDVTGTITTDGLTVDGDGSFSGTIPRLTLFETDFTDQNAQFLLQTKELRLGSVTDAGVSFTDRFKVNVATGDISFYDDTGVSQSFYWDASTEELGLGTTSPAEKLHLSIDSLPQAILLERTGTSPSKAYITNGGNLLKFSYDANGITFNTGSTPTERMRINSSGNVGIGNTVPSYRLSVGDGTADTRGVFASNNAFSIGVSNASGFAGWIGGSGVTDNMVFSNSGGTERMRIDASGNVGIGTSSPAGKQHTALATSHAWGAAWSSGTAVFGGAGSTSGALGISYNDTDGAVLGAIAPGVAWKPVDIRGSEFSFSIAGTEKMRIDASGNVGIGTSSPANKLDVTGTIGVVNVSSSTGTNYAKVQVNNAGGSFQFGIENSAGSNYGAPAYSRVLWNDGAYPTVFYTSSTERMRIDSSGRIVAATGSAFVSNTTTTSTSKTLTNGEQCVVDTATQTLTLPASPSTGDNVSIFVGDFTDTIVARNGSNIMGLAEDLTIDSANVGIKLVYVDASNGWRILV